VYVAQQRFAGARQCWCVLAALTHLQAGLRDTQKHTSAAQRTSPLCHSIVAETCTAGWSVGHCNPFRQGIVISVAAATLLALGRMFRVPHLRDNARRSRSVSRRSTASFALIHVWEEISLTDALR